MSGIPFPAKFKAVITDLLGITAKGQATMANSLPVALASNQSSIPTAGDIAHDAADSGNPLKIGGKAATSTPAAVADGDRVNAFFDERGRQAVWDGNTTISVDDGAGTLTVDGTVTIQDGGGTITVDGTVAVTDGDSTISVDDGGSSLTVDGAVSAVVTGDTNNDAVDAGAPVKIGGVGSTATPSAVSADGDRVNAWFDRNGRQAVFDGGSTLSVDDGAGTLTVDNAALNANRQAAASSLSTVRAASGATLRYNATNADGVAVDPVLAIKNSNVINSAAAGATGNFGFGYWSGGPSDDVYYFIPMRNYSRLLFVLTNNLDRTVDVTVYGYIQRDGAATQHEAILATAYAGISGGASLIVGKESAETGGSADYKQIRSLCQWDYIGLKVKVVSSAPTSGDVQLLVSRDVQ